MMISLPPPRVVGIPMQMVPFSPPFLGPSGKAKNGLCVLMAPTNCGHLRARESLRSLHLDPS